jgi:hypothetical protein
MLGMLVFLDNVAALGGENSLLFGTLSFFKERK